MISMKNTAIAAAMACALMAGKANAVTLPQAYTDNPTAYRANYETLTKAIASGNRYGAYIAAQAIGMPVSTSPADVMKLQQGIYSFEQMTYARVEDYAPPPPVVTVPMTALTPSTPPAQPPPQDNGAAAAAKSAQLKAVQTAGIAAGQAARPVPMTALTPSKPAPIPMTAPAPATVAPQPIAWTGLQPSAPTQVSLNNAVDSARVAVERAQQTLDYAESQPKHRIDIDPKQMLHRMATPDGSAPQYLQDANGYYEMVRSPGELTLIHSAENQLAQKKQLLADAEKAAANYTPAPPQTATLPQALELA